MTERDLPHGWGLGHLVHDDVEVGAGLGGVHRGAGFLVGDARMLDLDDRGDGEANGEVADEQLAVVIEPAREALHEGFAVEETDLDFIAAHGRAVLGALHGADGEHALGAVLQEVRDAGGGGRARLGVGRWPEGHASEDQRHDEACAHIALRRWDSRVPAASTMQA